MIEIICIIEETFLYLLYGSSSEENTSSTKYIIMIWAFWFIILFIVVIIVTYFSAIVEDAKAKRRTLFNKWKIKARQQPTKFNAIAQVAIDFVETNQIGRVISNIFLIGTMSYLCLNCSRL